MKINPLSALFALVIAAYNICSTGVLATCDRWTGPAGGIHCVKFNRYSDYQWATCRTNTYVKTKSKNSHHCEVARIYCHYQCMLDVYNKNFGDILPHCKCSPSDPVPAGSVSLPAWCYSPDGKNCTWYRECLNKAYPQCKKDKDDYAIKFAEKFCQLYDKRRKKFSSQGKRWIDAVRKCLQLKLVPLLDTTRKKTCAELKSTAFESHTPCYLNPDETSLSYCDLSLNDQRKVFWTIKSAFFVAFKPSVKGLADVSKECARREPQLLKHYVETAIAYINEKVKDTKTEDVIIEESRIRIKTWLEDTVSPIPIQLNLLIESDNLPKFIRRRKRSLEDDKEIARSKFAGKILDAVAMKENWKEKGVTWFGYANNETARENNTMSIRLFVAERYKYDVGNTSSSDNTSLSEIKVANLTTTLVELCETVLKRTLNLTVDGESIKIMNLFGCLDWDCKQHAFNITALKLQENNETASNETIRNGTVSNGTVSNETIRNGTVSNGTVSNGNKSNGVVMYGSMYTLLLPSFVFLVINILFISNINTELLAML